jgi:hypothetical protein
VLPWVPAARAADWCLGVMLMSGSLGALADIMTWALKSSTLWDMDASQLLALAALRGRGGRRGCTERTK